MKAKSEPSSGWYPGKFIKERRASKATQRSESVDLSGSARHSGLGSIAEDGTDSARGASEQRASRRRGYGPEKSVGQVSIKLVDARYIAATKPVLEVSFDNQCETHPFKCDQFEPKEIIFPIGDISADINIRLVEEYTVGSERDIPGLLVLPLTRYFGVTAPLPPKVEWLQFFPYAEVLSVAGIDTEAAELSTSAVTLRSGEPSLPGSAMNKSKQSIGFVAVQVEVFLIEPAYKLYMKSFHPDSRWALEPASEDAAATAAPSDPAGAGPAAPEGGPLLLVPFDSEKTYSLLMRLERLASLPAIVAPMLSFPEVIVIIILYGFICFGTEIYHLPLLFFLIVLANGSLTALDERHGHVVIWNRSASVKEARKKQKVDDFTKFKALQPMFGVAQERLEKVVVFLEKFENAWNWSDSRVSYFAYVSLFAVCLSISILSLTVGIRFILFVCGTAVLLYASLSAVFMQNLNQFRKDNAARFSRGQAGDVPAGASSDETIPPEPVLPATAAAPTAVTELRVKVATSIIDFMEMFSNFYARIPNSTVLEHRFIAGSAYVFENAQEMQDAAESFKKND